MTGCSLTKKVFTVHLILLLSAIIFATAKELPLAIRHLKCPRTNVSKCFIENGNKAIPLIARGDPEYDIPNMIPLKIPYISFISTPTLQVNMTDIEVHGLDKMKIIDLGMDDKKQLYDVTLKVQNITIVGDYQANGKVSVMPLQGKGKFSLFFKNGVYKSSTYTRVIKKKGEVYLKPENSVLKTKFEKIIMNLDNLFDGDKRLGDQVNAFLNENWETLQVDFGPTIERTVANIIMQIFENIASRVPLKNVFLPN